MISCEYWKISKNTYFKEHMRKAATSGSDCLGLSFWRVDFKTILTFYKSQLNFDNAQCSYVLKVSSLNLFFFFLFSIKHSYMLALLEYINTTLKERNFTYPDGISGYFRRDDVDGVQVILL